MGKGEIVMGQMGLQRSVGSSNGRGRNLVAQQYREGWAAVL